MIGITPANLNNFCNNKTTSVKFSILDKICDAINCEVSDILVHGRSDTN